MKLSELLWEWLYGFHKDNIKIQTFVRYECAINNYFLPHPISNLNIKKITARDIQAFINEKKRKRSRMTKGALSIGSVNIIITVLKSTFGYALEFGLIKENPCDKIRRISSIRQRKEVLAFTDQEQIKIEKYINSLNNPEYFGIILCLYTGLRIDELLALEWSDIDWETGIMTINKTLYTTKNEKGEWYTEINMPKTKSSVREIPLPGFVLMELRKLKLKSKSNYVVSQNNGKPMQSKLLRWRFSELTKKIGVRRLNFHALRHTFATRALESGMDVKTLAEIMGHANATITLNTYAHSMTEHKKKMMNNLPCLINYQ